MAEHIGIVINTDPGGYAQVLTDRKGACGGCQSSPNTCRSCLASSKLESRVANPVRAGVGDLVKVHMSSKSLFTGAVILYLLPIFGLMFGAATGMVASSTFGWAEMYGSIAGAIIGLGAGYGIVISLDRNPSVRQLIMPTITTIVRSSVGIPVIKKASCCESPKHT